MSKRTPRQFTLRPSGGDDTSAIQAALSGSGDVSFYPGRYRSHYVKVPPIGTRTRIIDGHGAVIELLDVAPRMFAWHRTAPHQTFGNITFERLTVDAMGKHPVSGTWSVFGFDATYGNFVNDASYMNIEGVSVHDCGVINVPTCNPVGNDGFNAIDIHIGVAHWGDETIVNHIKDILVDGCRMEGGERGVNINGYGYVPRDCNIDLDNIVVRNCWHDTMLDAQFFGSSTNYHIGQSGRLGYFELTDSYGAHSSDCGVEIDQPSIGIVRNVVIENAYTVGFYWTHFNDPLSVPGSVLFDNTAAKVTSEAGGDRYGYAVGWEGVDNGALTIRNGRYETSAGGWKEAVTVASNVLHTDAVTIDGLGIVAPRVSNPNMEMVALRGPIGSKSVRGVVVNGRAM
jgi:hypothetical protein